MSLSNVTDSLAGPFASRKPRQFTRQYTQTNPFQNIPEEAAQSRDMIFGAAARPTGAGGNPYVGPRPEQQRSMAAMEGYQQQAQPLYGTSLASLQDTAGGKYLDVYNRPEFQRLNTARQNIARDLFEEARGENESMAAARGNYNSSARIKQLNRMRGRIGNQAAQDIAQAGWTQYGQERGHMMDASKFGAQLAPGLAAQVFGQGEQLRSAEQAGNVAAIEAQLRAAGIDQGNIQNVLRYMQLASGQPLGSVVGSSPYQENLDRLATEASAFGSVAGGMGAV